MKYIQSKQIKLFLLIFVLVALGSVVIKPFKASALSGSDFRAGRIIDDAVFYNGSAMSAGEIQNFLNAKVPVCDTNGTQPSNRNGYATRADWGRANGYAPPYICLKDYSENTPAKAADSYCSAYSGGAKSAAQIIRDVGVACNISQKSMIVLLQKEQSLITDDWPWSNQYRSATGYACPDTAPCDSEFYGFFNQVYNAARQLKRYSLQPQSFTYRPGYNSIYFNPGPCKTYATNGSCTEYHSIEYCGKSTVLIENYATAALYNYTPYQPNASAINNLYGSGDSCGAYGNRNFWRLYNDWFGSTLSDRPISNMDWTFENLEGGTSGIKPTPNTVGITPKTVEFGGKLYVFYYDSTLRVIRLATAGNTGWTHKTLDGADTLNGRVIADVGKATTAIVFNNMLHAYYYNTSDGSMRHAWSTNGSDWNFETLDGLSTAVSGVEGNIGMSSTSVEYGGEMHIFYYDATRGNMRHAYFSSANGWKFQNLDGDYGSLSGLNSVTGQNPDATIYNGSLQLFYYDVSNGNLRHAWLVTGQAWKFENLDGDIGSIGRFNSILGQDPSTISHNGSLQLFYYDVSNGNLRHAWTSPGQAWKFENLDGDIGSIGRNNSNVGSMNEAFSFKDSLYIFYRDNNSGVLRYAWADSAGWHFTLLEGSSYSISGNRSNTGFWPTVTGYGDSLQLYYFDNDQRSLRHAFGNP
jgi:hypothetical protein